LLRTFEAASFLLTPDEIPLDPISTVAYYELSLQSLMKKRLSILGILFMLVLKHPPMPEFAIFRKVSIIAVRGLSRKVIALQFHIN
jgi:hypothetical protein